MKILYVSQAQKYSGAEMVLFNILNHHPSWQSAVFVPQGPFSDLLDQNQIKVIKSTHLSSIQRHKSRLWPIRFLFKWLAVTIELSRAIQKFNPDIIQANHLSAAPYCLIPALLFRKKFIWHMHDIRSPRSIEGRTAHLLSLGTNRILSISNAVTQSLIQCRIPQSKITQLLNGIPISDTWEHVQSRRTPHTTQTIWQIAQVGLIEPRKGIHILIQAIKEVIKTNHDIQVNIIGDNIQGKPDYPESLLKLINDHHLNDHIQFCGRHSDMSSIYPKTDIVVLPATQPEPFGLVLIEAMAQGCIVIGANIGGIPEIIDNGQNGLLFEPGNPEDLAKQIQKVITGTLDLAKIRKSAYQTVKTKFTIQTQVETLNQIYQGV